MPALSVDRVGCCWFLSAKTVDTSRPEPNAAVNRDSPLVYTSPKRVRSALPVENGDAPERVSATAATCEGGADVSGEEAQTYEV